MSSPEYSMTQEQREIFEYPRLSLLITAPAGCGKTEALAYRAKGLLERYDFSRNGRKLLVVSFTNQARDNINERLKAHIRIQDMRQHITVCNFHGLSARIINAHGKVIGLTDEWTIATYDWLGRTLRSLGWDRQTRNQIIESLQKIKLECLTDEDVHAATQKLNGQVREFAQLIEKKRLEEKIITYDDQIRTALWILQNESVAKLYNNHFFAAVIDEFQDLTPQQLRMIQTLCGNNVTYAGDPAQGIYSFAGANAELTYQEISKDNREIKLLKSFRSAPVVLEAINSLSERTGEKPLIAAFPKHWGQGGLSAYIRFNNETEEAEWVVKKCKFILDNWPNHRIGIISRTKFRTGKVKNELKLQNIPFTDWNDRIFKSDVARALRTICDDLTNNQPQNPVPEETSIFIKRRMASLLGSSSEESEEACEWLLEQLLDLDIPEIKSQIKAKKGSETIAIRKGVHCLTAHTGKGQQFDWVFIAGLEQGTIPFYKARSDAEKIEEARVLSVMLSRARIGFIATSASVDSYGHQRDDSEFLYFLKKCPNLLYDRNEVDLWYLAENRITLAHM